MEKQDIRNHSVDEEQFHACQKPGGEPAYLTEWMGEEAQDTAAGRAVKISCNITPCVQLL
jgi:hypothetical protein